MGIIRMKNDYETVFHNSREESLIAAKNFVRKHRKSYLMRRNDMADDVIDILSGQDILQRHICRCEQYSIKEIVSRPFNIEDFALYR